MQAKLQSKITLFLIKPIYELSETMDMRGPKWALKKKIAARKHATPLGAKPPLSLNPRNAPGAKYQELTEECRRQGWITRCEPIEVGCRGFAGQSLCRVLTKLCILGLCKEREIKSTIDAAERATKWLWLKREAQWSNAAGMDHPWLGRLGEGV